MIIDLHNHTGWGSGDTHMEPSALVEQAKRWGLDGICITEHNQVWDPEKIAALREKHGFLVIGGVEVDTEWGHILAFGLPGPRRWNRLPTLAELRGLVDEHGGVLIAAHPFRKWSLPTMPEASNGDWQAALREACDLELWRLVDAVEVYNGLCRPWELRFADEVAQRLGVKTTGGSDTHRVMELAAGFTVFDEVIRNERDLIDAIKGSDYHGGNWKSEGIPDRRV
ncbi:MAG: PHP domain-containing protein [Chloroflexi bacterium]|nr:PHP domain-containing protein [Chloroflexota bacterium]